MSRAICFILGVCHLLATGEEEEEFDTPEAKGKDPAAVSWASVVEKRVLHDLDSVPLTETHVVPNIKVVHGRPSLEVMRGCVKGCRFCQAGYIYRPLRERNPRRVLAEAERAVTATGTDELSLLSLSTGDYSCVNPVLTELMNTYAEQRVAVSLPYAAQLIDGVKFMLPGDVKPPEGDTELRRQRAPRGPTLRSLAAAPSSMPGVITDMNVQYAPPSTLA